MTETPRPRGVRGLLRIGARPFRALSEIVRSTFPILKRELVSLLRTQKAFRITLLTVGAASLVPLLSWPEAGSPMAFLSSTMAFGTYAWAFSLALFFFIPGVTAGAITVERERGTYELLYNTPLRPTGIVLGKLFAHVGFFIALFLFTLPVVCILYLLGGFQFSDFLLLALWIVGFSFFLGIVGLWCSMLNRQTARAVILAYALVVLDVVVSYMVTILLSIGFLFLSLGGGAPPLWLQTWMQYILLAGSIGLQVLLGLFFFVSLVRRARWPDLPVGRRPMASRASRASAGPGIARRPIRRRPVSRTFLTKLLLLPTRRGIPDLWNPVFVTSIRSDVFGSALARRLLFWGVLGVCALIWGVAILVYVALATSMGSMSDWEEIFKVGDVILMVILCAVALLFPGAAASALTGEVEQGRLDLLRGTLLGPWKVLRGKFLAALFGTTGLCALGLIVYAVPLPLRVLAERSLESLAVPFVFVVSFGVVVTVVVTAGLLAATVTRRPISAVLVAYVLSMGYLVGFPALLHGLAEGIPIYGLDDVANCVSPLFESISLIVDVVEGRLGVRVLSRYAVSLVAGGTVCAGQLILAGFLFRRRWLRG